MKNTQKGFIGIIFVIVIFLIIGCGTYFYYDNKSNVSQEITNTDNLQNFKSDNVSELKDLVDVGVNIDSSKQNTQEPLQELKGSTSTQNTEIKNKNLKTYTNVLKLYSFDYPSEWTYSDHLINSNYIDGGHDEILTVDFYSKSQGNLEKVAKVGIIFEEDFDSQFEKISQSPNTTKEKIIFGKNTFYKITQKDILKEIYYMQLSNNHAFFIEPERYVDVSISESQIKTITQSLKLNLNSVKSNLQNEVTNSFIHPLGLFTFNYPKNWSYELSKFGTGISGPVFRKFKYNIKQPHNYEDVWISIESNYVQIYKEKEAEFNIKYEELVLNNKTIYKITHKDNPKDLSYYIPFLNNKFMIIFEVMPDSDVTDSELVEVIKTLII